MWERAFSFGAELSINEQIIAVSQTAIERFLAEVPFHGYQVSYPRTGALWQENDSGQVVTLAFFPEAFLRKELIQPGTEIEWIDRTDYLNPQVLLTGKVLSLQGQQVEIAVNSSLDVKYFREKAALRVLDPVSSAKLGADKGTQLYENALRDQLPQPNRVGQKDQNVQSARLTWIVQAAAFILLGF